MNTHDFRLLARRADGPTRRAFVTGLASSLLGVSIGSVSTASPVLSPSRTIHRPRGRARQVIYLFLRGGMSHVDTLDPKPGARTQGPVETLRTRADGLRLGQYFPKLADQANKICVVRSMSSKQGAHPQAQYLMRTSYDRRGTIQHPSLGAWVQHACGRQNPTLPGHVILGGGADLPSAGFFPPALAALPIGDPNAGLQNAARPRGIGDERFERRLSLLQAMNEVYATAHSQRAAEAYDEAYADAVRLMRSEDLAAFDLDREPESMREAYGENTFGAGCLLARRLVEHGVRFVEVISDGWDTHADNFDRLGDLTPAVDQGLAALLADLDARGLLQETLVVLATEFGRTPDIDQDQGRNHYPKAFSCLLAGGGIRSGTSYGATDDEGREVVEDAMSIQDFNATIAHAAGVATDEVVTSPSGRPFQVADKGEPRYELFA